MREFLQGKRDQHDEEIKKYFLTKDTSIIWNRHYGTESTNCKMVENVTKMLKVGHMVVGHTVQQKINSTCQDKLWRVDVGISSIFDNYGKMGVL